MGLFSRQPVDLPQTRDNPWGSQDACVDDKAVLLGQMGKRCCVCKRVVLNRYLVEKDDGVYCPDHAPKEAPARCCECGHIFSQENPDFGGGMCRNCWAHSH